MTNLRRLVLSAIAGAAIVAFAAPAFAQAEGPYWHVSGSKVGGMSEQQSVTPSGELIFHMPHFNVYVTCEVKTGSGKIWNGTVGEGTMTITPGSCNTNVGCTAVVNAKGSNWPMPTSGPQDVFLQKSGYTVEYKGSCGLVTGVPVSVEGSSLKGTFENGGGGCIQYSETEGYNMTGGAAVPVSGHVCFGKAVELVQPSESPAVTTTAATEIGDTEAGLNAIIDPEGRSTTYQFEYGTTTSYGSKAPASPISAGSGTEPGNFGTGASGLTPNTTYHYRVVATNSVGTSYGADKTFTTTANWYVNGSVVGGKEEAQSFEFSEGAIFFKFAGGAFRNACEVTGASGSIWNGELGGEGQFAEFSLGECFTNIPKCKIWVGTMFSEELPIVAVSQGIEIGSKGTPMSFISEWNGCTGLGVPNGSVFTWSGTLRGEFNSEIGCLEFVNAGPLQGKQVGSVPVDAELCLISEGGPITLE
jgi:hypothetical protein